MLYQQPAFVLHSRSYRETSLLLTLFTPEFGKLNAVARGVRGSQKTAQKQAWLQPFQSIQINWRMKQQQGLVTLSSFEPYGARHFLQADANICGLYLNELLYRLLPEFEPEADLFLQYQQALKELETCADRHNQAWLLRKFEFNLLQALGYQINLQADVNGRQINPEQRYIFQLEAGLVASENQNLGLLGSCILSLAGGEFLPACQTPLRNLMRQVLAPYLGAKPLMTRALFQS